MTVRKVSLEFLWQNAPLAWCNGMGHFEKSSSIVCNSNTCSRLVVIRCWWYKWFKTFHFKSNTGLCFAVCEVVFPNRWSKLNLQAIINYQAVSLWGWVIANLLMTNQDQKQYKRPDHPYSIMYITVWSESPFETIHHSITDKSPHTSSDGCTLCTVTYSEYPFSKEEAGYYNHKYDQWAQKENCWEIWLMVAQSNLKATSKLGNQTQGTSGGLVNHIFRLQVKQW